MHDMLWACEYFANFEVSNLSFCRLLASHCVLMFFAYFIFVLSLNFQNF